MQFSAATVAAVAAFLPALVSAHVKMISPVTVFKDPTGSTDLDPLDPSGSNYPCFFTTGSTGEPPVYEPGSDQVIGLQGSAVHGGGSCQVSITYDNPPTKSSVFKVIKSYEGGCPITLAGNLPANPTNQLPGLAYTLPADIPSGDAVVAWSWFNRIGNREMYMRCAPIKISGSNTDKSAFNALPDIFKANIGNGCSTTEGTNVIFPNPGANLVGKGDGAPVGGDACGAAGSVPSPQPDPVYPTTTTEPVPSTTSQAPVLIVVPTNTPSPIETPVYTTPVVVDVPTPTEVVDVPTPTEVVDVPTPENPNNGTCVHGTIICTGLNTWSVCVYGTPKPMGKTAPGMNCKNGAMVVAPRSVRFSREHVHRRHNSRL